jgi:peptidyl-prolyl cis-trans isomerase B (cyclophilin B)
MSEAAIIKTSEGDLVLEFYPDVAPGHVENFKKLAKQGFYDGTCFHRVIKGFMIQGGDPNTKDEAKQRVWGTGGPGYQIKAEFNSKPHLRGVLSMARSNDPNSAGNTPPSVNSSRATRCWRKSPPPRPRPATGRSSG